MKKNYIPKNIAIIVTSIGEKYLEKCLKSISNQKLKPGQIIISIPKNCRTFKKPKNMVLLRSDFKNQVYQRCLAKKYINNKIKLIFQIDCRIILENSSINEILDLWNRQSKKVAGIGFIPSNICLPNVNLLQKILLTNSETVGKVLKSGNVSAWKKNTNLKKVDWLHGGCVTWRYKYCPDLFNRRYPLINWSVAEDLIYSFKKSKKYNLFVSNKVKLKNSKKSYEPSFFGSYSKGYLHAKIIKNFVIHDKRLSIPLYYYSMIFSAIFGMFYSLCVLNLNKLSMFCGRLFGCIAKTYNFKIF